MDAAPQNAKVLQVDFAFSETAPAERIPGTPSIAAEPRMDSSGQLLETERLDQIIVGADLEPHHPVHLFTLGGHHDHRHVNPAPPQLATHVKAAETWQHEVE